LGAQITLSSNINLEVEVVFFALLRDER